jgi:hypothetical protein
MRSRAFAFTLWIVGGSWSAVATLHAQSRESVLPIDSILARFERETRAHETAGHGMSFIVLTLTSPGFSARKDSLLNGLERMADVNADHEVRAFAAQMVASAGEDGNAGPPLPRVMQRLERIYRTHGSNEDYGVRLAVVSSLPLQGERSAAAALLRRVASDPDPGNNGMGPHGYFSVGDLRMYALRGLAAMGEQGRTVLQEMYRSREELSPQTRIVLESMAQRGFPVTDAVERRKAANERALRP